jgi:hypothetical protein
LLAIFDRSLAATPFVVALIANRIAGFDARYNGKCEVNTSSNPASNTIDQISRTLF